MPKRRVVAIVGRPNVGKSTLFNRFLGQRRAVVDDLPGVTRDRNYAEVYWNRRVFTLVDTGGYTLNPEAGIARSVGDQVETGRGGSGCDPAGDGRQDRSDRRRRGHRPTCAP